MLFYLTNMVLDVFWGASFWTVRKISNGIIYVFVGGKIQQEYIEDKQYETIILTKENIEQDNHIQMLLERTESQEIQIKTLTVSIEKLSEIIKNKRLA